MLIGRFVPGPSFLDVMLVACYLLGVLFLGVGVLGALGALDSLLLAFLFLGVAGKVTGSPGQSR